jgi:predicted glycosyltransferase involved in capsule biosynthesis
MNRKYQLEKTLRKNLNDNNMNNVEFIICDYNSIDKLKDYINNNFQKELKSGYLKYYFFDNIKYWHASICKNTTYLKANGKYIINLDCDNFIEYNGSKLLLDTINKYGDNIIIHQTDNIYGSGCAGRITMLKSNFLKLTGYDESFYPMGYQDIDLIRRGENYGLTIIILNKNNKCIKNSKIESCKNIGMNIEYSKMNNYNMLKSKLNIENNNIFVNKYKKIGLV